MFAASGRPSCRASLTFSFPATNVASLTTLHWGAADAEANDSRSTQAAAENEMERKRIIVCLSQIKVSLEIGSKLRIRRFDRQSQAYDGAFQRVAAFTEQAPGPASFETPASLRYTGLL